VEGCDLHQHTTRSIIIIVIKQWHTSQWPLWVLCATHTIIVSATVPDDLTAAARETGIVEIQKSVTCTLCRGADSGVMTRLTSGVLTRYFVLVLLRECHLHETSPGWGVQCWLQTASPVQH
jgi:hypothetical protein